MRWQRTLPVGLVTAALLMWGHPEPAAQRGPGTDRPAAEVVGRSWINSDPLTLAGLRGRVVLVEFWTYG